MPDGAGRARAVITALEPSRAGPGAVSKLGDIRGWARAGDTAVTQWSPPGKRGAGEGLVAALPPPRHPDGAGSCCWRLRRDGQR